MPGTTSTQGLIYPTKTDRLRELPAQQKSLALQLENRWNSHQHDLDRALTRPAVAVAATVAQTLQTFGGDPDAEVIRWDTVLFDTAGFADLSNDTRGIDTSGVPGYYSVGCWVSHGQIGGTSPVITLSLDTVSASINVRSSVWDNSPGLALTTLAQSVMALDRRDLISDILFAEMSVSGTGVSTLVTVHEAIMWCYWERDL